MIFRKLGILALLFTLALPGNASAERVWNLTSYLKGSADDVRQQMNGDIERLALKYHQVQKDIGEKRAFLDQQSKAALVELEKSGDYTALEKQLESAKLKMESLRAAQNTAGAMKAGSDYNSARSKLAGMEAHALQDDHIVADARDSLLASENQLIALQPAIHKAVHWRGELLDALRLTDRLAGPLNVGDEGILGTFTPTKIVDAKSMKADYDLQTIDKSEPATASKTADGVKTVRVLTRQVSLIINAVDSSAFKVGEKARLDVAFRCTAVQELPKTTIATLECLPQSDFTSLFFAIENRHEINADPIFTVPDQAISELLVGRWKTTGGGEWSFSPSNLSKTGSAKGLTNTIEFSGEKLIAKWSNGTIEQFTLTPFDHLKIESWIPAHSKQMGSAKPDNVLDAAKSD